MLRTRILAAATAAVLMLGMSVGGAGAAMATPPVDVGVKVFVCKYVGTPGVSERLQTGNNPISVSVNAIPDYQGVGSYFADAQGRSYVLSEDTRTGGGQEGEPDISECPPADSGDASASIVPIPRDCDNPTAWNLGSATITNATWGSPFVEDGLIKIVATANEGAFFDGGLTTQTFTAPYEEAGGDDCDPLVATAAVTVDPRDCFVGTSFDITEESSENVTWGDPVIDEEEGTITIVATATGDALFEDGLDGVSEDRTTRTFTEDYEPAGGDDCVAPAIGVTASAAKITCDTDGWYQFGPAEGVSEEDAALLEWSVEPGAFADDDEPGVQHPVSQAVTITITVSLVDSAEGDYALSDESGEGVVDPETGDISYTFEFTAAEDCELGAVVVPEVTAVDECVEEIELDFAAALVGVASFTVTASPNVSYTYTVNGGSPIAVVFPDGEDSVTIPVTPGDTVEVTAEAADGFTLPEGYEPWSKTFLVSAFCLETFPTTVAAASFTMPDCLGNPGRVTLTNEGGVIWTLNGSVVAGNSSYEVTPDTDVELTAALEQDYTWNDAEQQTLWNESFPAADNCSPELAFTGAGAFTNWLGVAAVLMMVAGMGFVVRRNRIEV